jgi:predicted DNA-binding transcriptional regulator YafY
MTTCDAMAAERNLESLKAFYIDQSNLTTDEGKACAERISTQIATVAQMSTESEITKLVAMYNSLIVLNKPEADELAAKIAAQINTLLQSKLDRPPSMELSDDMHALLQLKKDSGILGEQERYKTFLWICLIFLLLYIIVYLWNFK